MPDTHKAPAFIADCHLGKLAKYLRVMGFDTLYFTYIDDDELIALANAQGRIILTRDRGLHGRNKAPALLFETTELSDQLALLIETYHLRKYKQPFSRCIVCNTRLRQVTKSLIAERLPPKVAKFFDHFELCRTCDRIYWHGDHYKKMKDYIDGLLG